VYPYLSVNNTRNDVKKNKSEYC